MDCTFVCLCNPDRAVGLRLSQKLSVRRTLLHSNWTGSQDGSFDAALLRLLKPVETPTPVLAEPRFDLYPNLVVHGSAPSARVAATRSVVVHRELCPELNTSSAGVFCVDVNGADVRPGTVWEGPLLASLTVALMGTPVGKSRGAEIPQQLRKSLLNLLTL